MRESLQINEEVVIWFKGLNIIYGMGVRVKVKAEKNLMSKTS